MDAFTQIYSVGKYPSALYNLGTMKPSLLKVNKDHVATDTIGIITINRGFCTVIHNTDNLKNQLYRDLETDMGNKEYLSEWAVSAKPNKTVEGNVVKNITVANVKDTENVTS